MLGKLKQLNISIMENEPLKNHTTFQIGGPAKLFIEASAPQQLIEVLKILKQENIPYLIIGSGSNLLVADDGYEGAVIKMNPGEIQISKTKVFVQGGYSLSDLLLITMEAGLTGMEFAAGVPGTVGGAISGNAGTFGEDMGKVIKTVDFINDDLEIQTFNNQECDFTYRHSIFKEHDNWLIVSACLELQKGDIKTARHLVEERIAGRKKSQPCGYASAGCVFKNVLFTDELAQKLISLGWDVPGKFRQFGKIPVSWIIDRMEIKGKTIGSAQISEKHGNYIINLGVAKADEVVQLISFMKQQVRDKTGIQLQEEIRYLGFKA